MSRTRRDPPARFDNDPDTLLTPIDLEAMRLFAVSTTRNKISDGTFPFPYLKIGSNLRFRLGDVRDYIAAQRTTGS